MSCRVLALLRWCGLACLVAVNAGAQPADDATRDAARTLGLSGIDAYQAGKYDVASSRLEKAYVLISVPSLGLWSARALAKRNLLVEAADRYFEVASLQVPQGDAAIQRQAQVDARAELEQLRPLIPRLVIRVNGADSSQVTLAIDGQAAPSWIIGNCPHEQQAEVERLNTFRTVSSVGLIAGGVLAATGVVLLLSAPASEHPLTAVVSGETLTLTGRF